MQIKTLPFLILTTLAMGVSLFSLHYFVIGSRLAPPIMVSQLSDRPVLFLMHVAGGSVALALGVWQFLPRTRRSNWHRLAGRIYVFACLLGGIGGLAIAPYSEAGPVAQAGFGLLAVLWLAVTLIAWRKAVIRDFAAHRIWIWRSYGLTCAAITLRLILPLGMVLGVPFSVVYPFTSWACWISSLCIAEVIRRRLDRSHEPA